jgi:flavodoxin
MKALVVYDSMYGNTEKIARAIADALASEAAAEARRVGDVDPAALRAADLLVVGSPTQGFRPTNPIAELLKAAGPGLRGVRATAFDTRFEAAALKSGALRLLIKVGGYAAPRIGDALRKAGAALILPPMGFFVEDKEGPLKAGELERAGAWAKSALRAG